MITVAGTVETALSAEKAFAFLSQFENTSEWDPGTPVMEKLTPGPVAVGHRYRAEAEFKGKRQELIYEVIDLGTSHIKLRGENKTVTALDTISVVPAGTGSSVTYKAEFSLNGLAKLAEPFVKPAFNSLREPALAGLRNKLNSMA
ncbi:Polyketide cyclase / dehydrase and lipid transport [Arthrobacter ulcerisalmonis]|uniref:Polyketide cyclase / dehydrase and lipid transport n=1 Tax=Arthrobacter ulcerisalmonis TaxID=2483813 RepID=A0A3P5WR56_9MICC|nr:SRPBCC family protein [Arthrobacter ulcerisalmonis]VDC18433.1 Polyketide cyclase / dehydrase and lipid transport [Arthrobacter ulcerisalmonis]